MKKLKLNSTLNHKCDSYSPYEVSVEKVITMYGPSFEQMKRSNLDYNPYIAENKELMYIDSNDVAHCLLFVDYDSGDGLLVESEGCGYARKSQFIPNARALLESNELTAAETRIHEMIKEITANIAEKAHCGEKHFVLEDVMSEVNSGDFRNNIMQAVGEMLRERDDIQSAEVINLNVPFQSGFEVEAKPTQELKFYCPLHIVREFDGSEYDFDEEIYEDDFEEIPSECAVGCTDEINNFIKNYSEPKEEHRGLMAYYDDNPAVSEKVFSAIPSVKEIDGELMGVFECKVVGSLTDNELNELRDYLTGQCSDGFFEGMEQHPIKTADYGEIYVSFWNDIGSWSLQTEEEMGISQNEEPEINLTM